MLLNFRLKKIQNCQNMTKGGTFLWNSLDYMIYNTNALRQHLKSLKLFGNKLLK